MNAQHHTIWTPHEITYVEASEDEPRKGFVGRAVAMRTQGVEFILFCRNEADLGKMGEVLNVPGGFDLNAIYKATLIHSSGIEVNIPPAPKPEEPVAPPVEPEQPAATPLSPEVPVRGDDGAPIVTYRKPEMISDAKTALQDKVVEEEDDGEL